MSVVTNNGQGTTVYSSTYNNPFADALMRMTIDNSVLPCIRNGLQVTGATGLTVNVSAGTAKGQNITFTQMLTEFGGPAQTLTLPTDVQMPSTTVAIPDNSTGWVVLNVNIHPGPTVASNTYNIQADNNAGTPVIIPVFVTSLSPSVGSSYPYTQIVLAAVKTSGGVVVSIDMSGDNRSFDWSNFLVGGGGVTGDVKQSYNSGQPLGWIPMNDGTIGSFSSGATTLASNSAQDLYELLWNQIPDTWCPVIGGRGGSATADFTANKAMMLPATVGRALCNSGTATLNLNFTASSSTSYLTVPTTSSLYSGTPFTLSNVGGALPSPLVAATTYYGINIDGTHIQVAATQADVNLGNFITLTTNGTGTNTLTVNYAAYVSGQIAGETSHQSLGVETGAHNHLTSATNNPINTGAGGSDSPTFASNPTAYNVGDQAHNNIQPSTFIPVYIHI